MAYVPGIVGVDALLDGQSLRAVMYPDESLGFYPEPCVEGFQLPNVIVNGDAVWGKSDCVHPCDDYEMDSRFGWDQTLPGSYAYNNFADIVINSSPFSGMVRFYKASKYKEVRFVTVDDFSLLWDSEAGTDTAAVEAAIAAGKRMKIALLDGDGVWNIHSVDLGAYRMEAKEFRLDTPKDGYPEVLRIPEIVNGLAGEMAKSENTTFATGGLEFHLSRYRVKQDGTYLHQVGRDMVEKTYRRLKVFSEV